MLVPTVTLAVVATVAATMAVLVVALPMTPPVLVRVAPLPWDALPVWARWEQVGELARILCAADSSEDREERRALENPNRTMDTLTERNPLHHHSLTGPMNESERPRPPPT